MRTGEKVEVTIGALGHEGDGIAELGGVRLFVPWTLPGERWRVRLAEKVYGGFRALPLAPLAPLGARAMPLCRHFTRCGGCRLQHLPPDAYAAFKLARITTELARRRLEVAVLEPLVRSPPQSRRRLRLAFARQGAGVRLGLRRLHSHAIERLDECPVAHPELVALFAPLRRMLAEAGIARGEVLLTRAANGVDLALLTRLRPQPADFRRWQTFAEDQGLLRVSLGRGRAALPLALCEPPWVMAGDLPVPLPPGAFLQATEEGERALVDFLGEVIRDGERLVDLHAGLGLLSLPHRRRLARLLLVDIDPAAGEALRPVMALPENRHLAVATRDLERHPLTPEELAAFDLVLLDPPRAGARRQCEALAASPIRRVVYVACHPPSFARDARILADAGFRLVRLRPVDQFVFAADVELAALLVRD